MELDKIKEIIRTQLGDDINVADITEETALADFKMDSLDMVEIVMAIEDEFNITVTEEQEEKLKKVGDLIAMIKE